MKKYFENFFLQESGAETIEFIGIIVVAAVLIAVVASIAGSVVDSFDDQGDQAVGAVDDALNTLGSEHNVTLTLGGD